LTAIDERAAQDGQALEPRPPDWRTRLLLATVTAAGHAWVFARSLRVRRAIPGYAGALLVSASIGGIVDYALPGIGWWVALLCAGLFCLAIDRRMPG
jgi:hypothetical protein